MLARCWSCYALLNRRDLRCPECRKATPATLIGVGFFFVVALTAAVIYFFIQP